MGLRTMRWLLAGLAYAATAQATTIVTRWNLPGISSPLWESHPAIDPMTGDLWFVRSGKDFSGWRIMMSRCRAGHWSRPVPMPFAGTGLDADPYFTPDGRSLYFISSRASGGHMRTALDIWRAQRDARGQWKAPERLPSPVNSDQAEWFPRSGPGGWLYFGSRRLGGFGKDDIWRARQGPRGQWVVENAGAGLNSPSAEYEFQPAPDGRWGILATQDGLYRVVMTPRGWQRQGKYGPEVNVNGTEIGPLISPKGESFLFSRDAGGQRSGELFIAHRDTSIDWPPQCSKGSRPRA